MLILAIVVSLAITIACVIIFNRTDAVISIIMAFLFGVCAIITIIWLVCEIGVVVQGHTIDEKIALYEEENLKIEQTIESIVKETKEYEHDLYSDIISEDAINMAIVIPSLSSNELVKTQISIYAANKGCIKQLREEKINISASKFLIYFGS